MNADKQLNELRKIIQDTNEKISKDSDFEKESEKSLKLEAL